jgi:dihydrofolate reductase
MRKIVGAVFQTLDGVMQAPGGPSEDSTDGFTQGGWQMGFKDEDAGAAIGKFLDPSYALLLGRRTYDIFSSYWPFVEGEEAALGEAFTKADKYVLTHRDEPLEWENSHRLADIAALAAVKAGDGPELRIWGSGTLYPALIAAGLLDELTLFTYPLVVGGGKRTFRDDTPPGAMKLVDHQITPGGVIIATVRPDGPVKPGTANLAPPNPREEARQAAMADGRW